MALMVALYVITDPLLAFLAGHSLRHNGARTCTDIDAIGGLKFEPQCIIINESMIKFNTTSINEEEEAYVKPKVPKALQCKAQELNKPYTLNL
jgi:hypothetical protein